MLAIACGWQDADDLDRLRSDPAFKLACGRLSNPNTIPKSNFPAMKKAHLRRATATQPLANIASAVTGRE